MSGQIPTRGGAFDAPAPTLPAARLASNLDYDSE